MGRCILPTTLAAALAASGCGGPPAVPPAPAAPSASYSYEVRGDAGGMTKGTAESVTANVGKQSLEIKDGRLRANGQDYGPLKDGDQVLLDRDGKVYVNGTEVKPGT